MRQLALSIAVGIVLLTTMPASASTIYCWTDDDKPDTYCDGGIDALHLPHHCTARNYWLDRGRTWFRFSCPTLAQPSWRYSPRPPEPKQDVESACIAGYWKNPAGTCCPLTHHYNNATDRCFIPTPASAADNALHDPLVVVGLTLVAIAAIGCITALVSHLIGNTTLQKEIDAAEREGEAAARERATSEATRQRAEDLMEQVLRAMREKGHAAGQPETDRKRERVFGDNFTMES